MIAWITDPNTIRFFGFASSMAAILGTVIAAFSYSGTDGKGYSPLNHFISELGEIGVSRRAWTFNIGLFLAGVLLVPGCIGLGLFIPGVWSKLALAAGVIASLSLALVGVFPMNKLTPHIHAAMTFFRLGLAMILLFTIAITFQPEGMAVLPKSAAWAGLPAVLAYSAFLFAARGRFETSQSEQSPRFDNRPRIWRLALLEWLIFLTTVPWFFAVTLAVS